jgi:hypothetical protein
VEALWQEVWKGVQADFADVKDVAIVTQLVLRMLLATFLGSLLGYQREHQGKEAGLRSPAKITCLFIILARGYNSTPREICLA